jgi:diguanylate cyclase (GGDEF)-like protein/PAS domain S-box-containing protein
MTNKKTTATDETFNKIVQMDIDPTDKVFASFLDLLPNGCVISDQQQKIVQVNRQAEMLFGYSRKEMIGQLVDMLIPEGFRADHVHYCKKFFEDPVSRFMGARIMNIFALHSSGKIKPVDAALHGVTLNGELYAMNLLNDLSDYQTLASSKVRAEKFSQKMEKTALTDLLTKIPNRLAFEKKLSEPIEEAQKNHIHFALFFLDLDHFKKVNDTLGHQAGDELLKEAVCRIKEALSYNDFLARLAGDEFAAILSAPQSLQAIARTAQHIVHAFDKNFFIREQEVSIGISVGIAMYPTAATTKTDLMGKADAALYRSKETGRNKFQFYTAAVHKAYMKRLHIEHTLIDALQKNLFYLVYQPIYNLGNNTLIGVEALLRCKNTDIDFIFPSEFVRIAEEYGQAAKINEWVINTACQQFNAWYLAGHELLSYSFNVSPPKFSNNPLLAHLKNQLKKTTFPPELLNIEITETAFVENERILEDFAHAVKNIGIKISIDDFGTGFSSFQRLKKLSVNTIKIDQSFIADIGKDVYDSAIVNSILALAKNLNLNAIAEGIKTKEQLRFLQGAGCTMGQGFYFSKPLNEKEMTALLSEKNK